MAFFRRRHEILPPLDNSIRENNVYDVLETIDSLELPYEKLIIVGSAVLTLLGLNRRAHDLDLIAHPDVLQDLQSFGRLPNGTRAIATPASRPERPFFRSETSPLPTELFSHKSVFESDDFEEYVRRNTRQALNSELLIMAPDKLLGHKSRPMRIGEDRLQKLAQDRYDATLLEGYIRGQWQQ